MNYTIHQLKIFLKVLETKSITKTAEELHMTQPAISIQLKNFQDQFKIPLTEIHGRQLYVTDFGYEIAEIAERALENLDEIQFKSKDYQGLLTGKLKIAAASTGTYTNEGIFFKVDGTDFGQIYNDGSSALVFRFPLTSCSTKELLIAFSAVM
jgi:hypothetical protein